MVWLPAALCSYIRSEGCFSAALLLVFRQCKCASMSVETKKMFNAPHVSCVSNDDDICIAFIFLPACYMLVFSL